MEGGSPGNPEGVHQSGAWGLEPGDQPRGVEHSRWGGGKCWRITLACGGEVGQAKRKAGKESGWGGENRKLVRVVGESGMFHKKPSPPCSVRMRASALGGAAQTATSQRGSSRVTYTVILTHKHTLRLITHTHILHSVTPHRLGMARSIYIL